MRRYCRSDYMVHCANAPAGGRQALACLQMNLPRLSPACRQVVRATMPRRRDSVHHAPRRAAGALPMAIAPPPVERRWPSVANVVTILRACKHDLFQYCWDGGIGGGRDMACLLAHRASLSFRCRMALGVTSLLR